MRKFLNIVTEGAHSQFMLDRKAWLDRLSYMADTDTIATVLEAHGEDDDDLILMWWETMMARFKHMSTQPKIPLFRHIRVDDFQSFLQNLDERGAGRHWSINYGTNSPNWTHDGDLDVMLQGEIAIDQIDWEQTLIQNFQWPQEGEIIFNGPVFVKTAEDQEEDQIVKIDRAIKQE